MLYLRVLGGLALEDGGRPIGGAASQRARLTLLALLASEGERGIARERLLALFWPDKDADHARAALRQSLYALRRDTGEPGIVLGNGRLRLNREVIGSDLRDFDEALKAGDFGRAVELYQGELFQGFPLPDMPELQHWADGERERRANEFRAALEHLALRAEAQGESRLAVQLWQRVASSNPLSATSTVSVMKALARAGDLPAAVQCARTYERRVRAELEMSPDPSVVRLCDELRRDGHTRHFVSVQEYGAARLVPGAASAVAGDALPPAARVAPEARPSAPIAMQSRSWPRHALVVAAGGALVSASLMLFRDVPEAPGHTGPGYARTALAVLPFQNLSVEPSHAYFASGLHGELLTQLQRVEGLKVTSRQSVMGYAAVSQTPLRQIARELEVGSVVEGSVQVVGDRLRVTVQLIDANSDAHLWAERYDRTIDDAFSIQSDVAREIVSAVGMALSSAERHAMAAAHTRNAEAYRLYLQGRDYYNRPNDWAKGDLDIAQQFFERAIALDSGFALARAALSEVHGMNYIIRYDRSAARAERQREEAEAAVRLAPALPQAHFALGSWHYHVEGDYSRALAELRIALAGLPNDVEVWARIGQVTRRMGAWSESVRAHETTTELSPRDWSRFKELGATYTWTRRYPEAVAAFDRASTLAPDFPNARLYKGVAFVLWKGELDSLRAVMQSMPWNPRAGDGTWYGLNLLYWGRQADSMLQISKTAHRGVFRGQNFFLPASLVAAWAHRLRGDHAAARNAFDSARVFVDSALREHPDDERIHAARGLTLAGLGLRREALREALWLQRLVAYRRDRFQGGFIVENRARILAQLGEADAALDEIETLLARPSHLSVHAIRLDPGWDPIRSHPRFQAVLEKYGSH